MTQKTFDSQTATFIGRLVTSLPSDMTGPEMQKCIDDPKGLSEAISAWLRPKACAVAQAAVEKLLQPFGQATFAIDPKVDYKKALNLGQNKGFWIDPGLQKVFDLVRAEDDSPASVTLNKSRILESKIVRSDKNIINELGTQYKVSPIVALNLIATELQKVLAGKSSKFFNKSAWGLMYVEHLVVDFGWDSVRGKCRVNVWYRDVIQWGAGSRVFSATETKNP